MSLDNGKYYVAKPLNPNPDRPYYKMDGPFGSEEEARDNQAHPRDMVVKAVAEEPQPPEDPPPPPPPKPPQ